MMVCQIIFRNWCRRWKVVPSSPRTSNWTTTDLSSILLNFEMSFVIQTDNALKYISMIGLKLVHVCSIRLVFPTIQQNASVMAILPTFLDTLGRKIESAEREKDHKGGTRVNTINSKPQQVFFFNFYPAGINCRRNKMIVALIVLHSTLFANKSKIAGGKGVLGTYHFFHQHLPGTLRYAKSMGESIKTMNELYDQLTKLQGEAYTCKEGSPESCPENPKI